MQVGEGKFLNKFAGVFECDFCFSWKTYNNIGTQSQIGNGTNSTFDNISVLFAVVVSAHSAKNFIIATL